MIDPARSGRNTVGGLHGSGRGTARVIHVMDQGRIFEHVSLAARARTTRGVQR